MQNIRKKFATSITYCSDPYEAAKDDDGLIILTEWNEFRQLDLQKIQNLMKKPILLDGRNIYDPQTASRIGFTYIGVGR